MLRRRLYYALKPFLPWQLRTALRRRSANKIREESKAVWPIDEAAVRPPEGWKGWPDGKKFAFVLTHDVERSEGLEKCKSLAEFEIAMGFRSSFNFVPEGEYGTPPDLRTWLTERGFEVGVHDLRHDGHLFGSRKQFNESAPQINRYLKEWGATGFRAGFMFHQLDWNHDLDIEYDASTFDTDPFEPQPDAYGTIFPYWVPTAGKKAHRPGYVELPYTLAQDSTLFLLFQETTTEIWMRKVDWIVQHGGMVLLNIHPDYLSFEGEQPPPRTFPIARYRELLDYVKLRYGNTYWQPLPGELARWFKASHVSVRGSGSLSRSPFKKPEAIPADLSPLYGKKAAVLLYSYFPSDPRPFRAAEAMVSAGMEVDLLCLTNSDNEPKSEVVAGIRIFRVPMKHRRGNKLLYIWDYARFFFSSLLFLISRGFRRKYDIVHVHNMPDFLVFAAILPKLRGAGIILDLHDPMPELMTTIYGMAPESTAVRVMRLIERASIGFSDKVLTPNIAFKNLFASRSCRPAKIDIVMNTPKEEFFDRTLFDSQLAENRKDLEFRVMHHGSIVHRHGIDQLVEAIAKVRSAIPGIHLDIYGGKTVFLKDVMELARTLGVEDVVHYHGQKNRAEIAEAIYRCDLGVVPNRRSPFTEINFPTRLFEYLAMNRPVLAPNTQGIRDYFNKSEIITFEPGDVEDMASKIIWVHRNPEPVEELIAQGLEVYREHLWTNERATFLRAVATTLKP